MAAVTQSFNPRYNCSGDLLLHHEHTRLIRPKFPAKYSWVPLMVVGAPEFFLGDTADSFYQIHEPVQLVNEFMNTVFWFGVILDYTDLDWGSHPMQELLGHFAKLLYHVRRKSFLPKTAVTKYVSTLFIAFCECKPDRELPIAWLRDIEDMNASMPTITSAVARRTNPRHLNPRSVIEELVRGDLFQIGGM
jgi:hypothetical protein